jgi:hypothetical protein
VFPHAARRQQPYALPRKVARIYPELHSQLADCWLYAPQPGVIAQLQHASSVYRY